MSSQIGIRDKLDKFTRKWNLFSKEEKPPDNVTLTRMEAEARPGKTDDPLMDTEAKDIDGPKKKKKRFQLGAKTKSSDKLFNKIKRKLKMSRCENCGYFYVHDAEKEIFQCTFFEFSSEVDKKDVCENWTDVSTYKQPFF
jgi:hypothetical protein